MKSLMIEHDCTLLEVYASRVSNYIENYYELNIEDRLKIEAAISKCKDVIRKYEYVTEPW